MADDEESQRLKSVTYDDDPINANLSQTAGQLYQTVPVGEGEESQATPCLDCTHSVASWKIILYWQCLSMLLTGTAAFSELLAARNASVPTTQSCINYFLLSLHGLWYFPKRCKVANSREDLSQLEDTGASVESRDSFLRVEWWKYMIVAFADVEGNYCLVRAFQYTTITSVSLLDCFTIPCVMVLSRVVFKTMYNGKHMLGAVLCLAGLGLLVWSDLNNGQNQTADNPALGDGLVLIGCCFYAVSNVGQEKIVKEYDRVEYLAMIGIFGTFFSGIQIAIFERDMVAAVDWTDALVWAYMGGFTFCLFTIYISVPVLLTISSAVMMNLSFLTSDFWSLLVGVYLFNNLLSLWYVGAFTTIVAGLVIYNTANDPVLCCLMGRRT